MAGTDWISAKRWRPRQKRISAELPAGLTFTKVTDQAVNIREAVDEFMLKFFVALGVVMVVSRSASAGASASWSRRRCR